MQNMSFEGFENTGIKNSIHETDLFDQLYYISVTNGSLSKYSYNLSKLYYLEPDGIHHYYDKKYARLLLEEVKDNINKYVSFTNEEPDEEVIVLIEIACYLDSLTCKNELNKNIPNEEKYRITVLSQDELDELQNEEVGKKAFNGISLEEFLKEYGLNDE